MISNIELTHRITLKVGSTDYEITREAAEKLYTRLGVLLNKQTDFQLSYPNGVRNPTTFGSANT